MLILEGTITTNLVLVFCYVLPFFFAEAYVSPGLILASVSSDLIFDRLHTLHTCYMQVKLFRGKFEGRIAHVTHVTPLFKEFITITL